METKQATLNPGEYQRVTFSYIPMAMRAYQAVVDGLFGNFEAVAPGEYHIIPLYAGWNEITYTGRTGDIVALTSNIIGLEMIYGVEGWTIYNPDWVVSHPEWNTLTVLEYGKAYWIEVTAEQNWAIPSP